MGPRRRWLRRWLERPLGGQHIERPGARHLRGRRAERSELELPSRAQLAKDDLAFAKCMRANGVPNFPDPAPGGGFETPSGTSPTVLQTAQGKCARLMPAGPGSGPPPSAQLLAKVLRISECIRRHGVSEWPDPRSSVPHPLPADIQVVTDYMGVILLFPTTLDLQSSVVEDAASACGFALHNH